MKKANTIAWWIAAFLLFSCALSSFPSFGCLLFLIGVAVSLPLSAVRDSWVKKGLRGASKIALVAVLLIAGSLAAPDSLQERGAEKELPSETAETVEMSQLADAESVSDGGESQAEEVTKSAPTPEIEIPENASLLVAGEKGEYGKWTAMNKETFYAYYLPEGAYSVTNAGEYPAQVSVYEGVWRNLDTGIDEYTAIGDIIRLEVGESGEITIPEGWFVEIHEPDKAAFVRIGDTPEAEPALEMQPELESTPVEETKTEPQPVNYDALQELYVTFPLGVSFQEAVEFLDAAGLPYSSVKYNGSRVFQVSTEKSGTAQKYNKSGLSYVKIHYRYPRNENSRNDELEKYTFERIQYVPNEGQFSFESVSNEIGSVKRLGDSVSLGHDLTREEQIAFFLRVQGR